MKVFLNCDEANHICDKNQYKEAGFWNQVKLNFHLIYCFACRKYTLRNMRLSKAVKKANIQTLSDNDKTILRERLQKEMAN